MRERIALPPVVEETGAAAVPALPRRRSLGELLWYRLQALGVRAVLWVTSRVPEAAAPRLGVVLGRMAFVVDRRRRRVALDNLEQALGGEHSPEERRRIARSYYETLLCTQIEARVIARQFPRRRIADWFEIENASYITDTLASFGGAVFVSCHSGQWEYLPLVFGETFGVIHAVVRPLPNPFLSRFVFAGRESLGMSMIVSNVRAMPAMMRALRGGESVALLCDLYHRHHPFLLPFFGRPVTTVRAPGILAARIERPIVPAFCVRTGPFRYRILVRPPLFPRTDLSREAAARDLMERVNGEIEDFVRAHPESWQWNYRRWKLPPEDPDEPDELDDAKDA